MTVFRERYEIKDARVLVLRKAADGSPTAICVQAPQFGAAQWIPWSQVDDDSPAWRTGDVDTVIVSQWMADQRGWK